MSGISKPITENALQKNLVELSQRNEQTHLQIQTLNEMVVRLRKENAKLLELLQRTWDIFHDATAREFVDTKNELRELGVKVE